MRGLLARRAAAHSLDSDFYTSAAFHQLDLDHIWHREWVFIGHAASLPQSGDFVTVQVGDYSLIVIRGDDGQVRALHNVCRHRGSVLCDAAIGSVRRRIVCPYHQWSYELDGSLAKARHTSDDFEPADHGLAHAACEIVSGMVFVCVADDAPDFGPVRELVEPYLAPFDLADAKVAATSTIVENGNWKLVMENNRECFHCRATHPELCATFPEAPLHSGGGTGEDLIALERLVERAESFGLPSRFAASADMQYRAMRMPFVGDARSMTATGEPAVNRRFGELPPDNIGDVLLYHYPSTWNHFMADHAVTFSMLPLSATQTQLTTTWLVPGDAAEGVDYDVENLTSVWRATNAQDTALVERTQRGVHSPAYRPGPYSPTEEEGVIQFVDWYANSMLNGLRGQRMHPVTAASTMAP
jgi:Rieske 2Fe-2S family protein